MIVDSLNSPSASQFGDKLNAALNLLRSLSPSTPDGRIEIDGQAMFANVSSGKTRPRSACCFEAHGKYIDVQYLLSGEEIIEHYTRDDLAVTQPFDADKDCVLYAPPPKTFHQVRLTPGTFCVFYPGEPHMPGVQAGNSPADVKKVVVKIRKG